MRSREYSWYALSNAQGFGAKSIHYIFENLRRQDLTLSEMFDLNAMQLEGLLPEIGKGRFVRANLATLQDLDDEKLRGSFERLKSECVHLISIEDERYPASVLAKMKDNAPPILYCKGNLSLLNERSVSIVGARDVGDSVEMLTKGIASKLAKNGFNIASGYAKGVDSSAHLGALEANGTTTMILSFGVNHISLKGDFKHLANEHNTLFVSQFPPYERFSGQNAMARNKLVCAMSQAIVVMASGPERDAAGKMSGTFDAGSAALKMGLPVFVLSPDVLKPTPQGNIDLIKLGAIPFVNGNALMRHLNTFSQNEPIAVEAPQAPLAKASSNNPSQLSLF